MHIGVPLETQTGETRVAATPETIKKLIGQGHKVTVQSGAGIKASVIDSAYEAAGATIGSASDAFGAELILKVVAPSDSELPLIKSGTVLVGMLNPGTPNITGAAYTNNDNDLATGTALFAIDATTDALVTFPAATGGPNFTNNCDTGLPTTSSRVQLRRRLFCDISRPEVATPPAFAALPGPNSTPPWPDAATPWWTHARA